MTNVGLDLISGIDVYLIFEKEMRGGISYTSRRYSTINNKYSTSNNPTKPTDSIIYLSKNNLYRHDMSKSILRGLIEVAKYDKLHKYDDNTSRDWVLEHDLEIQKN